MTMLSAYALLRRLDEEVPDLRKNVGQSYDAHRPWCVWVYLHGDHDALPIHSYAEWELLKALQATGSQD